jgi:GntR family transcriptional regulator/MocR family aminotransferase
MIDLQFDLSNPGDGQNLSATLAEQIRLAIEQKSLIPGDQLPPSRQLANELGIARGTVQLAYEILLAEDILHARTGAGTFVAAMPTRLSAHENSTLETGFAFNFDAIAEPDIDFAPHAKINFLLCRPDVSQLPLAQWRSCLAQAALMSPQADYGDPRGSKTLRHEIAAYLRRNRQYVVNPDHIIITSGIAHASNLLAPLLLATGQKIVMENPCYPLARQIFQRDRANIMPCPTDQDGIHIEALPNARSNFGAIYVTPAHQFPLGGRLSAPRRAKLLAFARQHRVPVLEDDYDGEFRYDVPPLPPLAAHAPEMVIHMGTFSKSFFPDLRLGYLVAPPEIITALAKRRQLLDYAPNIVLQNALALFIQNGHFEKHLRKMRKIYRQKRQALAEALDAHRIPGQLVGLNSGLHAVLALPDIYDAEEICQRARASNIAINSLRRYAFENTDVLNGLVIGYAAPTIEDIQKGCAVLADCFNK